MELEHALCYRDIFQFAQSTAGDSLKSKHDRKICLIRIL